MEKFEEAVYDFLQERKYFSNDRVLGIIEYGSFITGYNHKDSDVDVLIIMDDEDDKIYRGVSTVNGFKIEYFEKPISDIYLSLDNDFATNENAYYTIIGQQGNIIFDRNGKTHELKDKILKKYSEPLPKLSGDDAKEMVVIIDNRLVKLKTMHEMHRMDFEYNYYLTIEKIRKFYSRVCGCPNIPVDKAYRVYTDSRYRESFGKEVPDSMFVNLYFKALTCNGSQEDKLNAINELYNYSIRNIEIDPNNYRILVKSRNNPLNLNHE